MIHMDPPINRKPLPLVEVPNLQDMIRSRLRMIPTEDGCVATSGGGFGVQLTSDSAHLRAFFAGNFGRNSKGASPIGQAEATIVALSRATVPELPSLRAGKRYIDPDRTLIVSLGSEYYGNVKVSIRGLCSSAVARRGQGGFVHGASMVVRGSGIVISGISGAGKTTITRALMSLCRGDVHIINDDWGWADQDSGTIVFTGEPRLHMKYRSVHTIAPELAPLPSSYLSENYEGDFNNPHARLLIARDEVFGAAVKDISSFDAFIVVTRNLSKPAFARSLDARDIDQLEAAEYSDFYGRHERFMDGSLLLVDERDRIRERVRFERLLAKVPGTLVNNVGPPSDVARRLLAHLGL
jgi:hypothetical protein